MRRRRKCVEGLLVQHLGSKRNHKRFKGRKSLRGELGASAGGWRPMGRCRVDYVTCVNGVISIDEGAVGGL